jgi:chorismate synthase
MKYFPLFGAFVVALVLARAMIEKFGGDSLTEARRNFDGYIQQIRDY